jgi:hypothetical protein
LIGWQWAILKALAVVLRDLDQWYGYLGNLPKVIKTFLDELKALTKKYVKSYKCQHHELLIRLISELACRSDKPEYIQEHLPTIQILHRDVGELLDAYVTAYTK